MMFSNELLERKVCFTAYELFDFDYSLLHSVSIFFIRLKLIKLDRLKEKFCISDDGLFDDVFNYTFPIF